MIRKSVFPKTQVSEPFPAKPKVILLFREASQKGGKGGGRKGQALGKKESKGTPRGKKGVVEGIATAGDIRETPHFLSRENEKGDKDCCGSRDQSPEKEAIGGESLKAPNV